MRSLWLAVSVLAVANVLAFVAVVGWLKASDRIDRARLEQVRQLFAKTVKETNAEEEQRKLNAENEKKAAEAQAKAARPALTAEERLHARVEATEIDRQRAQRLADENAALQAGLAEKLAQLESLKDQITLAKQEFEQVTSKARETVGAEQFKKTLGVLEAMKPERAKLALKEIMLAAANSVAEPASGSTPATPAVSSGLKSNAPASSAPSDPNNAGKAQVVSYLNAMDEGVRAKVLQEFLKDDPKLAAELLERLRVRGVPPALRGVPANDPAR